MEGVSTKAVETISGISDQGARGVRSVTKVGDVGALKIYRSNKGSRTSRSNENSKALKVRSTVEPLAGLSKNFNGGIRVSSLIAGIKSLTQNFRNFATRPLIDFIHQHGNWAAVRIVTVFALLLATPSLSFASTSLISHAVVSPYTLVIAAVGLVGLAIFLKLGGIKILHKLWDTIKKYRDVPVALALLGIFFWLFIEFTPRIMQLQFTLTAENIWQLITIIGPSSLALFAILRAWLNIGLIKNGHGTKIFRSSNPKASDDLELARYKVAEDNYRPSGIQGISNEKEFYDFAVRNKVLVTGLTVAGAVLGLLLTHVGMGVAAGALIGLFSRYLISVFVNFFFPEGLKNQYHIIFNLNHSTGKDHRFDDAIETERKHYAEALAGAHGDYYRKEARKIRIRLANPNLSAVISFSKNRGVLALTSLFITKFIIDSMHGYAGIPLVPGQGLQQFLSYIHYGYTLGAVVRAMGIVYVLSFMWEALKRWIGVIKARDLLKEFDRKGLLNNDIQKRIEKRGVGVRELYDLVPYLNEAQKRVIAGWIESGKFDIRKRPDFVEKLAKEVGASRWERSQSYRISTGLRALGLTLISPILILVAIYHGIALLSGKRFSIQSNIPLFAQAGRSFLLKSWHMSIISTEIYGITGTGNAIAGHSGIFGQFLNAPIQALEASPQPDANHPGYLLHPYSAMNAWGTVVNGALDQYASDWAEKTVGTSLDEQKITGENEAYNDLSQADFAKNYPKLAQAVNYVQDTVGHHLAYEEFSAVAKTSLPLVRISGELARLQGGTITVDQMTRIAGELARRLRGGAITSEPGQTGEVKPEQALTPQEQKEQQQALVEEQQFEQDLTGNILRAQLGYLLANSWARGNSVFDIGAVATDKEPRIGIRGGDNSNQVSLVLPTEDRLLAPDALQSKLAPLLGKLAQARGLKAEDIRFTVSATLSIDDLMLSYLVERDNMATSIYQEAPEQAGSVEEVKNNLERRNGKDYFYQGTAVEDWFKARQAIREGRMGAALQQAISNQHLNAGNLPKETAQGLQEAAQEVGLNSDVFEHMLSVLGLRETASRIQIRFAEEKKDHEEIKKIRTKIFRHR